VLLLIAVAAVLPSAVSAVVAPERVDGAGVERVARALCLLAFGVLVAARFAEEIRNRSRAALRNGTLVAALLTYWLVGMGSLLWNDRSLPQLSALAIPVVIVGAAVYGGGPRLAVRVLEHSLLAVCYASLVLAVVYPRAAFPSGPTFEETRLLDFLVDNRLAGVASHPNTLALVAAMAALLVVVRRGQYWPVHLVAAASVLALSESRTAAVALGVALIVAWAATERPKLARQKLPVLLAASLWSVVIFLPVLAAVGALDVSFNGRTSVWDYALSRVDEHPLLGLGPGVWVHFVASGRLTELATSGHNQFVESLTTLGIAGSFCLAVLALLWLRSTSPRRSAESTVAIAAFGLIWAFAILESPVALWGVSPQSWLLVVLTVCCLGVDSQSADDGHAVTREAGDEVPRALRAGRQ
jgi:hypothetical protein